MDKIKVLVTEDHVIVREGLRAILDSQPDIQVVGEATNGLEAVQKTDEAKPDIILMDISMPEMNGLDATRRIKQTHPEVKILALTMHEGDECFFEVPRAGASSYIINSSGSAQFLAALRGAVTASRPPTGGAARQAFVNYATRIRGSYGGNGHVQLTGRERQVVELVAQGCSNEDIAARLSLKPSTVRTHRANVMAKLGLPSRTELVKYALSRGLVVLPAVV
jgi:two-component system response regulator NreC